MLYIDSLTEIATKLVSNPIIAGLTCNPTIIKEDRPGWDFARTLAFLQELPGEHFIQGSLKSNGWLNHIDKLLNESDIVPVNLIIKLPWEPLIASSFVPRLHDMGLQVCATAVYTLNQYYTALCSGVDYVAVYYDRMRRSQIDPIARIGQMIEISKGHDAAPRLLAASIKDLGDIQLLLHLGVHDITLPLELVSDYLKGHFPCDDFNKFEADFK